MNTSGPAPASSHVLRWPRAEQTNNEWALALDGGGAARLHLGEVTIEQGLGWGCMEELVERWPQSFHRRPLLQPAITEHSSEEGGEVERERREGAKGSGRLDKALPLLRGCWAMR